MRSFSSSRGGWESEQDEGGGGESKETSVDE
jgi:hypothetical protein